MNVMVMNFTNEGWSLEFENGAIMNQGASEHIKDRRSGHPVCVTGAFAGLVDKEKTMQKLFGWFSQVATVPIVNMEGCTGHPLQALADAITMEEHKTEHRPKVVLGATP
jgi:N-succinyl-L-ornithine transcarbamylase